MMISMTNWFQKIADNAKGGNTQSSASDQSRRIYKVALIAFVGIAALAVSCLVYCHNYPAILESINPMIANLSSRITPGVSSVAVHIVTVVVSGIIFGKWLTSNKQCASLREKLDDLAIEKQKSDLKVVEQDKKIEGLNQELTNQSLKGFSKELIGKKECVLLRKQLDDLTLEKEICDSAILEQGKKIDDLTKRLNLKASVNGETPPDTVKQSTDLQQQLDDLSKEKERCDFTILEQGKKIEELTGKLELHERRQKSMSKVIEEDFNKTGYTIDDTMKLLEEMKAKYPPK